MHMIYAVCDIQFDQLIIKYRNPNERFIAKNVNSLKTTSLSGTICNLQPSRYLRTFQGNYNQKGLKNLVPSISDARTVPVLPRSQVFDVSRRCTAMRSDMTSSHLYKAAVDN